jgi:hypothetical protein
MTTEQVFDRLWSMCYKLEGAQFTECKKAISTLAELFPEEYWGK